MVAELAFSLSAGIIIFLFALGWSAESNRALVLTPFTIFSAFFLVRVVPGFSVGVLSSQDISVAYIFVLPIAYFALFIGYFLTGKSAIEDSYLRVRAHPITADRRIERPILALCIVVIALGFGLYGGVPPAILAMVDVLGSDADAAAVAEFVAEARRTLTKSHIFGGEYRGLGIFRELIFCAGLVAVPVATHYFLKHRGIRSLTFLILALGVCFVYVAGDGTRGRFMVIVLSTLIPIGFHSKLNALRVLALFAFLTAIPLILSLFTNKGVTYLFEGNLSTLSSAILERIFVGNSINDVVAIRAIEDGFIQIGYGKWLVRDLLAMLPGANQGKPLAYYLYVYEVGGESTTYLTGTSISRAFADGGILGVVAYFFVLGLMLKHSTSVVRLILRRRSALLPGATAAVWMGAAQGYVSGIAGVIFLVGFLCVMIVLSKAVYGKG